MLEVIVKLALLMAVLILPLSDIVSEEVGVIIVAVLTVILFVVIPILRIPYISCCLLPFGMLLVGVLIAVFAGPVWAMIQTRLTATVTESLWESVSSILPTWKDFVGAQ